MIAKTPKKPPSINEVVAMKKSPDYSQYRLTRGEAIRRHCIDCSAFQLKEVRECWNKKCALYRYRLGREEELNL